jgi:hypothetical protein
MTLFFSALEAGDCFKLSEHLNLREFGPQCPMHRQDTNCTFTKTTTSPPPRSYFGGGEFTNARRLCDNALFNFSCVSSPVIKI